MKKLMMSLVVAVMLCVVGAGCGSSVPKATDEDVQNLVFQIAKDAMLDSLAPHLFSEITGFRFPTKATYAKVKTIILSDKNINATDQKTRTMVKRARVTFAKMEQLTKNMKCSLENIRTVKVEEKYRKSTSAADLKMNEKIMPITFSAQYTDDDKLYVETSGLNFN